MATSTSAPVDVERRRLLLATQVSGGVALIASAYPFVVSLEPSQRARANAAPVPVSIADLRENQLKVVAWRGSPVWLMRRSASIVRSLEQSNPRLADPRSMRSEQPESCRNATRSLKPEIFVCVGICTHLGCSPVLRLDDAAFDAQTSPAGGFLCPCHGSRFDLAGRVVKNVPAPLNLVVPDHRYTGATDVLIGEET
jgi:ubiquinol-cytochrome c reductase iron-sulfur subunit